MALGAASHKLASTRLEPSGRLPPDMRQQGDSAAALDDGAALFRECTAPPSLGKGLEKVAQTKLASPQSCQLTAAGWTSTSAVEKLRQTKPDGKLRQTKPKSIRCLECEDPHGR